MKGTLFSSDFVTDKDGNVRLIEVNTDTGIVEPQKYIFDWSDFIGVLNSNSITEVDCVYKYDLHHHIVDSLSSSLETISNSISTFTHTIVSDNSIFPTAPTDAENKFILRLAYDESAILDSEYAKDGVKLLSLFVDNNDSNLVCNFFHSSSEFGEYNTLDKSYLNPDNIPDINIKTPVESHSPLKFYKIGGELQSSSEERYDDFLATHAGLEGSVVQQYHISQDMIDSGTVSSIRSFDVVYGSNLDLVSVAQYNIASVFDLPETMSMEDALVSSKHYYEFATNTVKNKMHGILENQGILDVDGNSVQAKDLVVGNRYQSYFISGSPNTDDYEVLRQWTYQGETLPSGSYLTSSVLLASYEDQTFANEMTEIILADSSSVIVGGEARVLVHDHRNDIASYQRVTDLTTDYAIFGMNGTCTQIAEINLVIFDEQQPVYTYNFEDVDNFILENGSFVSFFVVHNLVGGSCFPAGTKVTVEGGEEKNIEDIQHGDFVLSFNEETKQTEYKKVIGSKQPIHNDLVKYKFSDGTELISTFDHPLYVNGLDLASFIPQWTNSRYEIGREVGKIKIGDIVRLDNGSNSAISEIQVLSPIDTQTYIITVDGNHNFYANGILVHNK